MTTQRSKASSTLGADAILALSRAVRAEARPAGPVRVVVLGGGFAGVYTAKHLVEELGRRSDVEVELLSEENYFVFQPLLPEVAAGGIAATHVVNPIREMIPGARFRCCRVVQIDFENKRVVVSQGDARELALVPYDHLVFAVGKVTSFASMKGAAEHAFAMKDLGDAFRLRNQVLRCLELADIEEDAAKKAELLTFVVAGGGFSGVETMGELEELVSRSLRYFPNISPREVRFALVHSQTTLLPEMPEKLGLSARKVLESRGVEMLLGARVQAASPTRVYLADGRVVPTRTFVCTVGNASNPIVKLALAHGFTEAQIKDRGIGALLVDRSLACIGKPGYWGVGDCCAVPSPSGSGFCPPTAQFALREARQCAKNILATIDKKPLGDFSFKALGMLASLGKRSAVAVLFGIHLTGFIAWFMWRTVYLSKLPGAIRRLRVTIDWTLDLFFPRDITQLQVFRNDRLRVQHHEPGERVVSEGEIGRELYLVVGGTLEVLDARGAVLNELGPRDVFGEKALLEDTRRTATVRAKTAVDVLALSRADFHLLVEQLPVLEEFFAKVMATRTPPKVERAAALLEGAQS
jgi:NADH dehydrogenase